MSAAVAVVADDLTGAADAAAGFLRAGLSAIVTWADPHVDSALTREADVIAVDAGSRALGAADARAVTAAVVTAMFQAGVTTIFKKIDSTLRGHIGVEVRAAIDAWHPGSIAVVAPAFPAMGRTTVDGRQRLHGVTLDRPAIAALLDHVGIRSRVLDLRAVRSNAVRDALSESMAEGHGALVCDAETDDDLLIIARAGVDFARGPIWVGTGGLASAVAANCAPRHRRRPTVMIRSRSSAGIVIVVGSGTPVAMEQAAALRRVAGIVSLPPDAAEIASALRAGRDILVSVEPMMSDREDVDVARGLGQALKPLATDVGGVIVTGGETATQVLRGWGVRALNLLEEIESGVPLATTVGSRALPVVTKAGAFGDAGTLVRALGRLRELTALSRAT
jgi:D-threonate/D-erythronate kinase